MKKVLITGAAGFIGSHFVKVALEKGYDILALDKLTYAGDLRRLEDVIKHIKFFQVDITDRESLEKVFREEKPDMVVHFAAESHVDRSILDPLAFIKTNVEGTFNLLDLSKKFEVERFINISTDEIYGELEDLDGKFTEESCLRPNSPYSASKASADMLGRAYYRTYNLQVITVRPSNNYGPWQYPEKLIPVVILKAIRNEPIPVYGTGKNRREWLYVKDCAVGILTVMEKGRVGEVYNLGSGIEKENLEVVKAILRILGKPEDLISFVKDRPGHDFRYRMSSQKIKRELGFSIKTDFEEGLKLTVDFYINHLDWVQEKEDELKNLWRKVYS